MRILLTNDDGIHSEGLWAAARTLKELGEVIVVAPDRDHSGIGSAVTILDVVRTNEAVSPVEGVAAHSVQGTPADCVVLAVEELFAEPFDVVVSGINQGANLGTDVILSGTVGAAFQGYFRDIPSIAVSVAALTGLRYEAAARTAKALAEAIAANDIPVPLLVNVNLPNIAPDKLEGVEMTTLGWGAYLQSVEKSHDTRRSHYWIRHNRPTNRPTVEGSDTWAVRNKRVSISAIHGLFDGAETSHPYSILADKVAEALA